MVVYSPQTAAPDWGSISVEVHCPLCEYNLRGLTEPRCPECGYRFEWGELRDATRQRHPYLFEHYPSRNIWSFCRTAAATIFFPRSFWKSLNASQPSNSRRLVLFWILTALPALVLSVGILMEQWGLAIMSWGGLTAWSRMHVRAQLRSAMLVESRSGGYGMVSLTLILWPLLTLFGLLVFQWSMRKARVRFIHVVRCVIYSCDVGLIAWIIPAAGLVSFTFGLGTTSWGMRYDPLRGAATVAAAVLVLMMIYRLALAYRFYMRFNLAVATVLSSQVIAILLVCKLWMMAEGY